MTCFEENMQGYLYDLMVKKEFLRQRTEIIKTKSEKI